MTDFDWATFWATIGSFLHTFRIPLTIVAILITAAVLRWVLLSIIHRTVNQVVSGVKKKQNVEHTQELVASPLYAVRVVQRTRTLGTVLNNFITVTIIAIGLIMILDTIGVEVIAIVGAAGVVAAGLAFGAQNVVKDLLNGIFMVFEDQLGVGDEVDLGEVIGTVEEVGLRVTKVRSVDGVLWFVRNGEILRVGNLSQDWARVIIDLPAPYNADVARIQEKLLETANTMASSAQWRSKILEKPEIWGIESVSAEAIVIRLVMKARPGEQWAVARELRLRLKLALDEINIDLPALNRVVIDSQETTRVKSPKPQAATTPQPVSGKTES